MNNVTLRWKNSDSTSEYGEAKPTVYAFTFDDLNGNYPLKTPSVLVQLMSVDDEGNCQYCVYCCVCNPALQGKEMTNPVEGSSGTYEYSDSDSIDSACVRSDLYKSCLMLGEQVYTAIKRMSNDGECISDVTLDTPNPYMSEFPYCECTIQFNLSISTTQSKINSELWDML